MRKIFAQGIDLSDADAACLENDLLNIEEWVITALKEKVFRCKERMLKEAKERLMQEDAEVRSMTVSQADKVFVNPDEVILRFIKLPSYKNRVQRELEK